MYVIYKGPSEWVVKVPQLVEYWKENGSIWKSTHQAGIMLWQTQGGKQFVGMPYMTKSGLICRVWEDGITKKKSPDHA